MRETYMHVGGVVVTDPLVRRFDDGRRVMSFRVASTSRRYDSNAKDWVDGQTLWVKVSCWRELADNAAECVRKGDRIVVWGRVRTEQWKGEDGGQRSDLAVEAESLGHDLAFGVATFERRRRTVSTQTLTADGIVDVTTGELTPVPAPASPASAAFEQGAPVPASAGPRTGPGADDDELDEIDELDDEEDDLDEEDDDAEADSDRGVTLLASA